MYILRLKAMLFRNMQEKFEIDVFTENDKVGKEWKRVYETFPLL